MWTKDKIRENLQKSDHWVERAVLAIYEKQTNDEKKIEDTKLRNGVGFNAADARRLTYYAKYLGSGKNLTGKHKEIARNKILKYSNQLTKIANGEI